MIDLTGQVEYLLKSNDSWSSGLVRIISYES